MNSTTEPGSWRSRTGLALLGFVGIASFFPFTEQRARYPPAHDRGGHFGAEGLEADDGC